MSARLARTRELGPAPAWLPALFGLATLAFHVAGAALARQLHSTDPGATSNTPPTPL